MFVSAADGPADGTLYTGNLRGALSTDVYICSGDGAAVEWAPTFTQHGFRYAELSGGVLPLTEDQVSAMELHTDVEQHSTLAFSAPLLNAIQHAVVWSQRSNIMSGVPTDCPQRDERKGWMGDAALSAEEAVYNCALPRPSFHAPTSPHSTLIYLSFHFRISIFNSDAAIDDCSVNWIACMTMYVRVDDVAAVYTKWLELMVDDQRPDGAVTDIVPAHGWWLRDGAPSYQSAFPTIAWALTHYAGDRSVAYRHHDSLVRYYGYSLR